MTGIQEHSFRFHIWDDRNPWAWRDVRWWAILSEQLQSQQWQDFNIRYFYLSIMIYFLNFQGLGRIGQDDKKGDSEEVERVKAGSKCSRYQGWLQKSPVCHIRQDICYQPLILNWFPTNPKVDTFPAILNAGRATSTWCAMTTKSQEPGNANAVTGQHGWQGSNNIIIHKIVRLK